MPDMLFFYSKSKGVPPGEGANEEVSDPSVYAELARLHNWRKVLSNFHYCPFTYKNRTYNTIEHAFQAAKIAIVDSEKAEWFTVESGHEIGEGDGLMARKNRKLVVLNKDQLRQWDAIKDKVMHDAAVQKYAACPEARAVLKATGCSELWHIVLLSTPVRFTHLEQIREGLKREEA